MTNFIKIDTETPLTLQINIRTLFSLLDMFVLIIGIFKSAKYPEDLEEVYDILDKYMPDWKNKDWKLDI